MATWKLLTDEEARQCWDQALVKLSDYSPLQTYAWGEYRRGLGWEPCRWAAFNEGDEIIAMMQGALRRHVFGTGLIWCEGGPVGDLSACDDSLHRAILHTTALKRVYCRFRCDRERHTEDVLRMSAQGWSMSWSPLTTNYSMTLDLTKGEDRLLAGCEQNWRRNLRRANESNLAIREWVKPNPDEVLSVYIAMQNFKGLEEQLSREEIEQLVKNLTQQIVLYRCDDENGELLSLLGCLVLENKACALFWATNERGRKLHASYAVFWALVQHCKRIGITSYDLAGIDPASNPGVYRFKRASGAAPIEFLGEWDWASPSWLRWLGNWAIAKRSRIRQAESALNRSGKATKDNRSVTIEPRGEVTRPAKFVVESLT